MNSYLDKFKNYLKEKGMKLTPERKAILEGVFSLHKHFDVDELYDELKKEKKRISLASIYRTLPILIKSDLINETLRCQGKVSYELIFGHKHHDHMVCINCGKIIEFRNEKIEELQNMVCRNHSFKPIEHRLGIRGYCKECQKKIK